MMLASCASIKTTEPVSKDIDRSRIYTQSYAQVWAKTVDWFADHNVIIEKIEKESGLITAKYLLKSNEAYLDCGKIKANGVLGKARVRRYGSLNVTVRSISPSETKVTVNFFGEYKLDARDSWDGRLVTADGPCVSTGVFETEILNYINR